MNKRTFVRRLLALATAAVMLLSAVSAMAAFHDTGGHWAEKTLTEWQEQGLIDGYSDGGFHPNASVTRAEFAKLLNNALNFTAESAISFTDVKESDWFYAEIAKAAAAGYAQGSNGAFYPGKAITRAEAAAMIVRAVNLTADEKRADAFTDAAAIPAWAKGSVGAAAESGYMNGYPDGTFGAGSPITRAEAVVTLDRVRKDTQSVTVEKAGTTLENETVAGNLIIAASVGEGNVTLKNMTIRGDLIVRGGGANSVYLDGTKVSGSVQMQKENVHLRLMGSTTLGSVEISQPCRITQDSSFKGVLGTVVIDLEKDSSKEIQIEVPAERVEVVSRANVTLHADMEKLVLSKNAEGAQLEIKRGATVGQLTADAKVKLTGSGTVSSLVVSVSDVTVSGSLSVKKTETEGGAKPPTTSGGSSSGGGGVTLKEITGIAPITAEVPYGASETDARAALPTEITLNVKDGSTVNAAAAGWNWADGANYEAKPATDTAYTATTAFTVPSGYTYSGTLSATATVTVKALDTSGFDAALAAAQSLQKNLTTNEAEATADPANKIFITSEAEAAIITKDVRFTTSEAETALTNAVTAATTAQTNGFASQQECTNQTTALTAAVETFKATINTGANATTNAYILNAAKKWLNDNREQAHYAYDSANQPLKQGTTYWLPVSASLENALSVKFEWTKDDITYLNMQQDNSDGNHSLTVKTVPTEPKQVTFSVKITRNDTNAVVGTIDYTATIGAPIHFSDAQPSAPRFASGPDSTGEIYLNLDGVEAITSVDISKIGIVGRQGDATRPDDYQINEPKITGGAKSLNGVCLTASISSGKLSQAQNFPISGNDADPVHLIGMVTVTIHKEDLTLDESTGWYFPDNDLKQEVDIWLVNPQMDVITQRAQDYACRNISVRTKYVGNAPVQVAYTKTNQEPDVNKPASDGNVWKWIEIPHEQSAPDSDGTKIYSISDVSGFSEAGDYYVWCRAWEGATGAWLYIGNFKVWN